MFRKTYRPGRSGHIIGAMAVKMCLLLILALPTIAAAEDETMLIDDFSKPGLVSALGTEWRGVSDRVMGGVSEASVSRTEGGGRQSLRLRGDVRLENNGGFIQAALNLAAGSDTLDATDYRGIRLVARGNGERYSLHLRTPENTRPWQSYRAEFTAGPDWQTVDLPFADFAPYRLDTPLDITRLRRLGLVAVGRAFSADLMVSSVELYR
ncbi:unnamed protein product [Discosporangium mesarthrocarpum]